MSLSPWAIKMWGGVIIYFSLNAALFRKKNFQFFVWVFFRN